MSDQQLAPLKFSVGKNGYIETGNYFTNLRAKKLVDRIATYRHFEVVAEWASKNSGPLKTPLGVRVEIANELLVLLEALGGWAMVDPTEVFPKMEDGIPEDWLF
ncbi:MAG: hypothetical protein KF772_04710 [Cryobacterium sp.]|nr:hypothetical protein [Cryobacterium sp.]